MRTPPLIGSLVLTLSMCGNALADSRSDWQGYDWHRVKVGQCIEGTLDSECKAFRALWDWKRNQWVEIYLGLQGTKLTVRQELINNDPHDDDFVCTTILFQDALGENVAVYHANLYSVPMTSGEYEAALDAPSDLTATAKFIYYGSKQCRKGAGQDDEVYARVRKRLP